MGSIGEVTLERWHQAQNAESACWKNEPADNEDWNLWWADKFSNYESLSSENIESIYEVGCGPYAKNIEYVFRALGKIPQRVILEDPLLEDYIKTGKSVRRFATLSNVTLISSPMEKFTFDQINIDPVDLVICNNVLDHVQSVKQCFHHMFTSLKSGGILILGQDLTNEEDERNHPDLDDVMHPIRIDEQYLLSFLSDFTTINLKVLSREEGRNPDHHYGTLIYIGRKP